jgi:phage gp29-like protein
MIKQKLASMAKAVKQKWADGVGTLQAEGARSSGSNLNYMSVNTLDPTRLASAFASADQGYIADQAALFELVEEQDPHIFAELAKRRRSVTGLGWKLHPPKDATQSEIDRTAELQDMLTNIPHFEDAQYDLTDAIGKGFTALEIDWQTGSVWLPRALNFVPQRMFQTDRNTGELMLLKMGLPEPLREGGWVVHEHRAKSGYIEQAALFRVLAWTYAYKAYNIRDMQRFLEVYGLPLRLGKYPAGIGKEQRNELLRAVRNIGSDGAGVVPSTMSIEFIQAQAGKVDDFLNATAYWEQKQSKAILGGELDGKTTSEARIMIYDKVRREILLHDVRQVEPTMNGQIVKPIALINGMFAEDRLPKYRYDTEESVDQGKMVKVLNDGATMGMEIDVEYAHQVTQIPRAKAGAKLLLAPSTKPDTNNALKPADAALVRLAALASEAKKADVTGIYAAKLAALSAPHEEELTQRIAAIVAESGSFDEALDKIAAMTTSPSKDWTQSIAEGMAAANLAGRVDAEGGK